MATPLDPTTSDLVPRLLPALPLPPSTRFHKWITGAGVLLVVTLVPAASVAALAWMSPRRTFTVPVPHFVILEPTPAGSSAAAAPPPVLPPPRKRDEEPVAPSTVDVVVAPPPPAKTGPGATTKPASPPTPTAKPANPPTAKPPATQGPATSPVAGANNPPPPVQPSVIKWESGTSDVLGKF